MEVRNLNGTLNRTKMNSKSLEEEGTAKESLPFLITFVIVR